MAIPRVIIVDDEQIGADGLAMMINMYGLKVNILKVLYSSQDALSFLEDNQVEIVITDINMPEINGIELIKRIKNIDSNIQIMILTGFGTLDYAKQAMKLGVQYFIQKPCPVDELKDGIENCLTELLKINNVKKLQWKQKIENTILGNISNSNDEIPKFLFVMHSEEFEQDFNFQIKKICGAEGASFFDCRIDDTIVYCIFYPEDIATKIKKFEKNMKNIKAIIFMESNISLENVKAIFEKGKVLLEQNFYDSSLRILDNNNEIGTNKFPLNHNFEEEIILFQCFDYSGLKAKIQWIINQGKTFYCPPKRLKKLFLIFCENILSYGEASNSIKFRELSEIFGKISDVNELEQKVLELIRYSMERLQAKSMKSTISGNVNWLIENNYADGNLSLKWISKNKIFLNPEYLGKVYLKETGIHFSQKLLEVRLVKAQELLDQENKVYEVAAMVGYEKNPEYFIQLFKKNFGFTPKQYMKKKPL